LETILQDRQKIKSEAMQATVFEIPAALPGLQPQDRNPVGFPYSHSNLADILRDTK
jgi:hypothetical protein